MKPLLLFAFRLAILSLDFALGALLMGTAMYRMASHDLYWSGGRE